MADHGDGKLIPPADVLEEELAEQIERKVRADITERILREARIDDQVAAAIAAVRDARRRHAGARHQALFKQQPDANGASTSR